MPLAPKTRQALKSRAHALKPVVLIGNQGLTPAVSKEIDRALNDHELIKIRVASNDRELRRALINEICTAQGAELVQLIGNVGVLFRKNLT